MIIADENISYKLIQALRYKGFSVYSIFEQLRGASDHEIAQLSLNPPRIILTEDSDFGRMVFESNVKVTGVVFLRFQIHEKNVMIEKVLLFFEEYSLDNLTKKFATITPNKTRISIISE